MSERPSCYNRPDFFSHFYAPDGFDQKGARVLTLVPHTMSTACKQWGPLGEAKKYDWNCTGCRHRPTEDKCTLCGSNGNTFCVHPGKEGCLRVHQLKEEKEETT